MTDRRTINLAIIGCGLMGRELASAAARFSHLVNLPFRPRVTVACDSNPETLASFVSAYPDVRPLADWRAAVAAPDVDAVYIAVPHRLHAEMYIAALEAGKHLFGEKPFGIDARANAAILEVAARRPAQVVVCSSEFPFFPGAQRIVRAAQAGEFGRILEVRAGLLHSSDMDPQKPGNWKRDARQNGEAGCMADLGLHALHVPLRLGWGPRDVRAVLSKVVAQRPDGRGGMVACDTWDNATLLCTAGPPAEPFPLTVEMKRMAPGHMNTWFLEVFGTSVSMRFSTRHPRTLETLRYARGREQAWEVADLGYASAYPAITGSIFEFGFPDALLQMLAAFCDEIAHGRSSMKQPFHCATPQETAATHRIYDAALHSWRDGVVVPL